VARIRRALRKASVLQLLNGPRSTSKPAPLRGSYRRSEAPILTVERSEQPIRRATLLQPLRPEKEPCLTSLAELSASTVSVHCQRPLSASTVSVHCQRPLSASTVSVHCQRPRGSSTRHQFEAGASFDCVCVRPVAFMLDNVRVFQLLKAIDEVVGQSCCAASVSLEDFSASFCRAQRPFQVAAERVPV